jgi:hypothetical protein
MGIFDFLKSSGPKEEIFNEPSIQVGHIGSIPIIKPEKEIYECYDEVFSKMINDITGLAPTDTTEILAIIKSSEGGFLSMGGYHSIVWERYFKGKNWLWNEYEEWNATFKTMGRFPSRFPKKKDFVPATIGESLNQLKVSELKNICIENQASLPAKAKKSDLIETLKSIPNIISHTIVASKIEVLNSRFGYELYSLFMRTIYFRGICLYNIKRAQKIGMEKFKIMHTFEEDKEFVELALKKNPNALHPVFPSDMSVKQSVIEF